MRKDESVIRCILAVSESIGMSDPFGKAEGSIFQFRGGVFGGRGRVGARSGRTGSLARLSFGMFIKSWPTKVLSSQRSAARRGNISLFGNVHMTLPRIVLTQVSAGMLGALRSTSYAPCLLQVSDRTPTIQVVPGPCQVTIELSICPPQYASHAPLSRDSLEIPFFDIARKSLVAMPTKQHLCALLLAPVLVHELRQAVAPICVPSPAPFRLLGTIRAV